MRKATAIEVVLRNLCWWTHFFYQRHISVCLMTPGYDQMISNSFVVLFFFRFLLQCLEDLDANLRKLNSRLFVIRGQPANVFPRLFKVSNNRKSASALIISFKQSCLRSINIDNRICWVCLLIKTTFEDVTLCLLSKLWYLPVLS